MLEFIHWLGAIGLGLIAVRYYALKHGLPGIEPPSPGGPGGAGCDDGGGDGGGD
ncbi:hypothetical protein [Gemmobacter denitrificans]|uniref:Uncharacterized protein n=1 Tax=Gemmobacter denitrificans TaxID=3123040 RepID=A0ABU8BXF2_9RHOB